MPNPRGNSATVRRVRLCIFAEQIGPNAAPVCSATNQRQESTTTQQSQARPNSEQRAAWGKLGSGQRCGGASNHPLVEGHTIQKGARVITDEGLRKLSPIQPLTATLTKSKRVERSLSFCDTSRRIRPRYAAPIFVFASMSAVASPTISNWFGCPITLNWRM